MAQNLKKCTFSNSYGPSRKVYDTIQKPKSQEHSGNSCKSQNHLEKVHKIKYKGEEYMTKRYNGARAFLLLSSVALILAGIFFIG